MLFHARSITDNYSPLTRNRKTPGVAARCFVLYSVRNYFHILTISAADGVPFGLALALPPSLAIPTIP